MRTDLRLKLLGVVAVVAPALAVASHGGAGAALAVSLFAGLSAAVVLLAPLRPDASRDPALDGAIEELEGRIEEARAEQLEVARRAETAGRFREEFVAAVRHELKTPLNAILGFADLLRQEVDGPLTERQREDLDAIRSAGVYLGELIEAVLSEWRPHRATPLPMSRVDLRALLEQTVQILEGQVRGRPIRLRVSIPEPVRGPLADERRLQQVLINLGTNALRATERGEVVFGARDEGPHVCLWVRDTGPGIDPDALPGLFVQFERGDASDGAGLGLAISREMVEWHGGFIEVRTRRDRGTEFRVMIPREIS